MDAQQLHILRHALGVGETGHGTPSRKHFVTGEGSDDYASCLALVSSGHMERHRGSLLTGGGDLFLVTDLGAQAAIRPRPRLTPAQRRYQRYLDADSSMTFGEWLKSGRAHG